MMHGAEVEDLCLSTPAIKKPKRDNGRKFAIATKVSSADSYSI